MSKLMILLGVFFPLGLTALASGFAPTSSPTSHLSNALTPLMTIARQPDETNPEQDADTVNYQQVIDQTIAMVSNPEAQNLARQFGLKILDITWEDTGRYQNSAVGPNISDMTIQVQHRNPQTNQHQLYLMPVIRHPNFSDTSADVSLVLCQT